MINQGQASTVAITIYGLFIAIVQTNPDILGQFGVPAQYISSALLILLIIWNYLKPRALDSVVDAVEDAA